jgi:hypothetical protein
MDTGQSRREFLKTAGAAGLAGVLGFPDVIASNPTPAELILTNGGIHTLQKMMPTASAAAIQHGRLE